MKKENEALLKSEKAFLLFYLKLLKHSYVTLYYLVLYFYVSIYFFYYEEMLFQNVGNYSIFQVIC